MGAQGAAAGICLLGVLSRWKALWVGDTAPLEAEVAQSNSQPLGRTEPHCSGSRANATTGAFTRNGSVIVAPTPWHSARGSSTPSSTCECVFTLNIVVAVSVPRPAIPMCLYSTKFIPSDQFTREHQASSIVAGPSNGSTLFFASIVYGGAKTGQHKYIYCQQIGKKFPKRAQGN